MGRNLTNSLFTIFLSFLPFIGCFNVDLNYPVINKHIPSSRNSRLSYFGFSVVQHIDHAGRKSILTGAPRGNTSQPGIIEGGEVYKCLVQFGDNEMACEDIEFDSEGDEMSWDGESEYKPIERKSFQWFGATLSSSIKGTNDDVLACAPRYIFKTRDIDKMAVVGKCMLKKRNPIDTFSPAKQGLSPDIARRVKDRGFAQYGIAGTLSADGDLAVVGAVGSYNWRGQVYSHNLTTPATVTSFSVRDTSMQHTKYRGYSIALGHFTSSSNHDIAVGIPRGNNMTGEVEVYESDLGEVICRLNGSQVGEYFGHSLAVGDVNGDGNDDLFVGAPFHQTTGADYDTGRVYVFYFQKKNDPGCHISRQQTHLEPRKIPRERFGHAMAIIGDINKDNYNDLAVGAPYGGTTGQGSVYIFHGARAGLNTAYSQVIDASAFPPSFEPIQTFGFSLSGGMDMDGNGYPDIAVGAYSSDALVQLWSRPVVKLTIETTTNITSVDVDNPNTRISTEESPVASFSIKTCITYTGESVSERQVFTVSCRLGEEDDMNPRAFLMLRDIFHKTESNATLSALRRYPLCMQWTAYIKPGITDKLTSIKVNTSVEMVGENGDIGILADALDPDVEAEKIIWVQIEKNCGTDEICVPDLRLSAKTNTDVYILGSDKNILEIEVNVENAVEDEAFEAKLLIQMPQGTTYRKIHGVESPIPPRCSPNYNGENALFCDLGNPFPARSKASFILQVMAERINGSVGELAFLLHVNSSNQEDPSTLVDNFIKVSIRVEAEIKVEFSGVSKPEQVLFNSTLSASSKVTIVGPVVKHLYELWNLGPSTIQEARVFLYWPSHMEDGEDLLYLMYDARVNKGTGSCVLLSFPDSTTPSSDNALKGRHRRDSSILDDLRRTGKKAPGKKFIGCTSMRETWCTVFECSLGPLSRDQEVVIEITSRLFLKSIIQQDYQAVVVTSGATAEVVSLPYGENVHMPKPPGIVDAQISTVLAATDVGAGRGVIAIWVVVVSVIGGLTMLGLLILILYKCGFFKRIKAGEDGESEGDDILDYNNEVSKRQSGIDTVNRKLIFKNGISISIEEKAYKNF